MKTALTNIEQRTLVRSVSQPSVRCYGAQAAIITSCSGDEYWYHSFLEENIEIVPFDELHYLVVQRDKIGCVWFDGFEYLVLRSDVKTMKELACIFPVPESKYVNFDYNKARRVRILQASCSLAWYRPLVGGVIEVNDYDNEYVLSSKSDETLNLYLILKTDVRDLIEDLEAEIKSIVQWLKENPMHDDFTKQTTHFSNLQMQLDTEMQRVATTGETTDL